LNRLLNTVCTWCLSLKPREKPLETEADRLRLSMRTTAKARYTASVRLKYQGKFTFATTTLLSLGLIFIPLIQNSGVPLALKVGVLNAMQIFLAVSVLVY
jgi:SMODS and SLOG-associating 2TM effector domain family 5